jgi:hypothetical protein
VSPPPFQPIRSVIANCKAAVWSVPRPVAKPSKARFSVHHSIPAYREQLAADFGITVEFDLGEDSGETCEVPGCPTRARRLVAIVARTGDRFLPLCPRAREIG